MNFKTLKVDANKLNKEKVLKDYCFGQKCEDYLVNLIFCGFINLRHLIDQNF